MNVLLFIILTAYLLVATRLLIVGLDCYDRAPAEVREAPYWMFLASVIFNAVTFPIGFMIFIFNNGVEIND